MANEYLKRKPTSPGNVRVWTWASWFKLNETSPTVSWAWLFNTSVNGGILINYGGSPYDSVVYFYDHAGSMAAGAAPSFRDLNAWYHLTVNYDSGEKEEKERIRFYMNGERLEFNDDITPTWPVLNYKSSWNSNTLHSIGRWEGGATRYIKAQYCDQFWVDGQAIAPEVFGFYKNGDGYMSSGTTNGTDFKPGQWSPRLPKSIKHNINSSGGFGTNGFYLPMNDSSNPGADFHCTPNTIVKLKGEDSPQPRNGAPTTSDAFVSQLREEPGTLGFDGCIKLDGNDGLDVAANAALNLGTGDFTIEAFYYLKEEGSYHSLFDMRGTGGDGLYMSFFRHNSEDKLYLYANSAVRINDIPRKNNQWMHVAICRSSGTTRAFIDGELAGSFSDNLDYVCRNLLIGQSNNNTNDLYGFISNFRIVKGTALYTSNFTRPTSPLENVANTILLCANSSTSATASTVTPSTITAIGDVFATKNELTGSIILAAPFISNLIGSNKITNGSFDTVSDGQDGYDNGDGTIDGWQSNSNSSLSINGNTLRWTQTNSGSWQGGNAAYAMGSNFVVGKTYSVKYKIRSSGDGNYSQGVGARIQKGSSWHSSNTAYSRETSSDPGSTWKTIHWTWKAEQDNYGLEFFNWYGVNGSWLEIDDVEVYEQDTRDYSADIRGSGTNKTVNVKGKHDVADCPSHYGSALICNTGAGNYTEVAANAEFADLWDVDHTIEFWYKNDSWDGSYLPHASLIGLKSGTGCAWRFAFTDKNTAEDGIQLFGTNGFSTGDHTLNNDWNHCAVEQYTISDGTIRTTVYVNGVAAGQNTGPVGYAAEKGSTGPIVIGTDPRSSTLGDTYSFNGQIQDVRIYKGVAKYKGGFDVAMPYTPVNFTDDSWRTNSDNPKNNFATLNRQIGIGTIAGDTLANLTAGNLYHGLSNQSMAPATMGVTSGKWYAEFMCVGGSGGFSSNIGVAGQKFHGNNYEGTAYGGAGSEEMSYIRMSDGGGTTKNYNAAATNTITLPYETGDIIGVTIDADTKEFKYYKNGTLFFTDTGAQNYNNKTFFFTSWRTNDGATPVGSAWSDVIANFGQNPAFCGHGTAGTESDSSNKGLFKYAPPTGFLALCTDNLPAPAIPDPGKHFKTVLYTGDSAVSKSINGVGFKPDLVWIKCRSHAKWGPFVDSVRGNATTFYTNSSNATNNEIHVPNFSSDGFTVSDIDSGTANEVDYTYVAWCWKAGGKAVTNNDGSVTSKVSVNQEAGFSIVKFTSQTTNNSITVGHGLGKKPAFWLWKDVNGATGWYQYHQDMGSSAWLRFSNDVATTSNAAAWGGVNPTDTVFTQGSGFVNQGDVMVYAWAEIEGYSRFGSYKGVSSVDGAFINCGFKPAFLMIKSTSVANSSWIVVDSARDPYNPCIRKLFPSYSGEENVSDPAGATSTTNHIDLLSNGFKCKSDNSWTNNSGDNYIFAAFAESPFQTANAK